MTARKQCLPNKTGFMDLWTHSDHGNTYKGPAQVWTRFSSSSRRKKWTWTPTHYQEIICNWQQHFQTYKTLEGYIIYEILK